MAQQPNQQPLFGLVAAGQALITTPASQPSETSFLYIIPPSVPTAANPSPHPFHHLTVFLLPGVDLPPDTAAAIYVAMNPEALAGTGQDPNFRFLGGIGPGKESATFKLSPLPSGADGRVVIGIDIENAGSVAQRIQQLRAADGGNAEQQQQQQQQLQIYRPQQPSTLILAQRIIKNAYNFLASFSGTMGAGGIEVVPLKAFQDWWQKFENRVRNDPTFLERDQD